MKRYFNKPVILVLILFLIHTSASGWYDETHLAVSKAAGYNKWYNSNGADITKVKAGRIESYNHFFNNPEKVKVTPEIVLNQVKRYNNPNDSEGHLYGAIIGSLREYKKAVKKGRYAENHIAFCVHYVADLSQPLHNIPFDYFNKIHHAINDGIVNDEVLGNISVIKENMYSISLRPGNFERDLAREIARISNKARRLGYKLKKENRDMTKEEAYIQLGHSASLIKAILKYLRKID